MFTCSAFKMLAAPTGPESISISAQRLLIMLLLENKDSSAMSDQHLMFQSDY